MPLFEKLFEKYVEPMVNFCRKNCSESVLTVDNNLVCSMFRLMDCYMVTYVDTELKKVIPDEVEQLE